jgi:putative membrane protein
MKNMSKAIVEKNYNVWIVTVSVLIPIIVAALIFLPIKTGFDHSWVYFLPHLNGMMNSLTILFLIAGFIMIKAGNKEGHKKAMMVSFILGSLFLVSYLIYHGSTDSTVYGDLNHDGVLDESEKLAVGSSRTVYLIFLLTHILFAIIVAPLVLTSLIYALKGSFAKHRKIVKYAYPVWLYVSITGVIVYFMIRPYYPI